MACGVVSLVSQESETSTAASKEGTLYQISCWCIFYIYNIETSANHVRIGLSTSTTGSLMTYCTEYIYAYTGVGGNAPLNHHPISIAIAFVTPNVNLDFGFSRCTNPEENLRAAFLTPTGNALETVWAPETGATINVHLTPLMYV